MQTEVAGSFELAVVAGDVLALRAAGLAAPETWALLCQAAQALQDLFLSNGGVVGGSGVGPAVTPHTLELTPRGRVTLQLASPETARAYLPPEYRPGRVYSDTDSEKMWMYSLGRALLDTTPQVAALTGSVSVSPSSALQSVLAAMTEPDPRRRASLMNLLDVISEYCRTRLQSKPFTHIVMDMYREVVRSPQYVARKRAAYPDPRSAALATQRPHHRQNQHQVQSQPGQQLQKPNPQQQQQQQQHTGHFSKHQVKGALFKAQSRNSRSHPNLHSLSGHEPTLNKQPQSQSEMDIQTCNTQPNPAIHHARTSSQPEYSERVQRGLNGQTRSTHNLIMFSNNPQTHQNPQTNVYSDPIYALPVKPFLSSQDVRVNGLSVKPTTERSEFYGQTVTGRPRAIKNSSQPNIAHLMRAQYPDRPLGPTDDVRTNGINFRNNLTVTSQSLHRQYSNPQLPTKNLQESTTGLGSYSQNNVSAAPTGLRVFIGDGNIDAEQQNNMQSDLVSSIKISKSHGPVPPKPPRVLTTLKRSAAPLPQNTSGLNESIAPLKPPRLAIKNGPRARRGKPVQRAPSRLYRAVGGPTRCFNKNQCVGPEFVVRANQPPKILCVCDTTKITNTGRIVVILLTGQRVEVTCDPQKITAGELFQAIVQAEGLDENFTLGLAALLAGDFAMLPPETKLNKVAPPGWLNNGKSKGTLGLPTSFMLYLRLRFFLPSLRGTRSWISKHLLYLQIRRCILEQQLVCPLAQLVNLTGFALQAEFGNYSVNEHGRGDYFLLEHYIPETLILNPDLQLRDSQISDSSDTLRAQLHQAHRDRRGLDATNAEEMFIAHAQALPDYGSHYYIATVDNKELSKIVARLNKCNANNSPVATSDRGVYGGTEDIYQLDPSLDSPVYDKMEFNRMNSNDNIRRALYSDPQKLPAVSNGSNINEDIYAVPSSPSSINLVEANNNSNNSINNNFNKCKKSERNVWLAVHSQGVKLFERGGRPRDRMELVKLEWRDIQTLSYSKNSLVMYTRFNGKRCKFKLRMDHKKSYYSFKLTSLHHQFFLKLRSELTSLHGLAKDFGIPLMVDPVPPPVIQKPESNKPKITVVNNAKNVANSKYPMQLEELQNKENENPQKVINAFQKNEDTDAGPVCYTPEEDALYAQVNARLEPEGASRDTEDESDRALASRNGQVAEIFQPHKTTDKNNYLSQGLTCESLYATPKPASSNGLERQPVKRPEDLYAAIIKPSHENKNSNFPVPDEVWDVANSKQNIDKAKTSSLPNYGTPRQSSGFRTPSLPRRLGVKMGTRAIYSSVVQRDSNLADDLESLSVKSDTASSIQSASAQSNESPMPEAYVLNADIRTDDETFHVWNDDSMSASLVARLEELSFAEERILHTVQIERGHGGSIGLQVTEGNDGGVYVQAVSVGGSADMAGNLNKGDRIVAINGQSLLNLGYEEALKMLQSSSETVELVLSQVTNNRQRHLMRKQLQDPAQNAYLQNLRFDVSSEVETSSMTTKWITPRATDVASVQNTSSAYSSAASSSMGNHNTNNIYLTDVADTNDYNSAMEIGAPPPIPPRRRKRKTQPMTATRTSTEEHKTSIPAAGSRPQRKPRFLPPPPPPILQSVVPSVRKPQPDGKGHLPLAPVVKSPPSDAEPDSDEVNCNSKTKVLADTSPRFVVTQVLTVEETLVPPNIRIENEPCGSHSQAQSDFRNENLSGRSSPIPPCYSPLFFTLRDFQSVMFDCGQSDKSTKDQYDSILATDLSEPLSMPSFIDDSMLDECQDEVEEPEEEPFFRVTTTSVPFEKCLGGWDGICDSGDTFEETNNHIFENYMDRSSRLNARASVAFPFDDDTFNNFDKDEPTSFRSATKVRFLIESPSTSIPDLNSTLESITNIESLLIDGDVNKNCNSSVIITEIIEDSNPIDERMCGISRSHEFGNAPVFSFNKGADSFDDLDSLKGNPSVSPPLIEDLEVTNDDVLVDVKDREWLECGNTEILHRPRPIPSPRFMKPEEPKIEPILIIDEMFTPELPLTFDPRDEGFVKKQDLIAKINREPEISTDDGFSHITKSQQSSISERNKTAKQAFASGMTNAIPDPDGQSASPLGAHFENVKKQRPVEKTIFIKSELRDFINNDEDMDWNDSSDEEEDEKRMCDMTRRSGHSNLNDRTLTEARKANVLNRDTCLSGEVFLDEPPRSPQSIMSDKERSHQANIEKEQETTGSTLAVSSRSDFEKPSETPAEFKAEMNSVPVSVRRNSFLENMLNDNNNSVIRALEKNVSCSIIAAHPKPTSPQASVFSPPLNVLGEGMTTISKQPGADAKSARRSSGIEAGSNETSPKQLENETVARIFGAKPKVETIASDSGSDRRKSSSEVKSDVLSELLCNFSAIKLKSVEPRKRDLEQIWNMQMDDVAMIVDDTEMANERTEAVEKIKTKGTSETEEIRLKPETSDAAEDVTNSSRGEYDASMQSKMATESRDLDRPSPLFDIAEYGSEKTENNKNRKIDDKITVVAIECTKEKESSISRHPGENLTACPMKTLDNRDTIVSVDKCAIGRKIDKPNITRCNINDNNAMTTPVDVSNDQKSCDAYVSTIAPGSVRSFVELYEIQRDQTSKYSKSNYSVPPTKLSTTRRAKGSWDNEKNVLAADGRCDDDKILVKTKFAKMADEETVREAKIPARGQIEADVCCGKRRKNPIVDELKRPPPSRKKAFLAFAKEGFLGTNGSEHAPVVRSTGLAVPVPARRLPHESCLKSAEPSPKSEHKKTVTFFNDCNPIKMGDKTSEILNAATTGGHRGERPKTPKRKAPGRPIGTRITDLELNCAATVECDRGLNLPTIESNHLGRKVNPVPIPRSGGNSLHLQTKKEEISRDGAEKPGIPSPAPKCNVPQLQQPYVFYCRL